MSLAHITIVIAVFSLLGFIHDEYYIVVGYMYCKYLFPVCGSSFDEVKLAQRFLPSGYSGVAMGHLPMSLSLHCF